MSGPVVILGASGFVGGHLLAHLTASSVEVRAASRSPDRARASCPEATWVRADVAEPETLAAAFDGADAVVHLVHHMRADATDLIEAEARGARHVLEAAERAGVRRIVYLGGPAPSDGEPSEHLAARLRTGQILRGGSVSAIELRAGMIVGAGSESWLIVRDLAFRLPVMVLPRWLESRSQPIATRDVVSALARAIELPATNSRWYDLPGPETLSGREILLRVSAAAGFRPVMLGVPILTPSLSSHWIRLVSRADYDIAKKLVSGLTCDLVGTGPSFWDEAPDLEVTPLDEAIRIAIDEEDPSTLGVVARTVERVARTVGRRA